MHHHTVAHRTLEFDGELSVLGKGEKEGQAGFLASKNCKSSLSPFIFRMGKLVKRGSLTEIAILG